MGLIRGLALAGAAALMAGLAGCGGGDQTAAAAQGVAPGAAAVQDPNNPLIGSWRFVGFGAGPDVSPSGCSIDMTFSSTNWRQTQGGATTNTSVTYIPSATMVYVVGGSSGHITYILVDKDHIALDSFAPCTYARVT